MAPVFSLVLDRDVNEDLALLYPELYKDLTKVSTWFSSRPLNIAKYMSGTIFELQNLLHMALHICLPR
jgi:phospholipid-translocating ATPase